jgi:hypothetical protein
LATIILALAVLGTIGILISIFFRR